MKRSYWRQLACVMAVIGVTACGGDDDAADVSTETSSVTGPASTGEESASTEGHDSDESGGGSGTDDSVSSDVPIDTDAILRVGTLMSGLGGPMFDMAEHNQGLSTQWLDLIYDTMIRRTPDGLEPRLATDWQVLEDGTVLEITLRDGVLFQDGTAFDAAAVANAWNRPKPAVQRTEVRAIESVEVVEPLKVRVTFSAPVAGDFINLTMTDPTFPVPSPAALAEYGDDYVDHPVGAGPYAFDSYEEDQTIRLRRWDGYWKDDGQPLAGVDFLNIAPGAPAVTALASGQVDLVQISSKDKAGVEAQGLAVTSQPGEATLGLVLCTTEPPFDDPDVRAAMAHLVDRDAINQGAVVGEGTPTDQIFVPGSPFFSDELADRYPFDPDQARTLWEDSGAETSVTLFTFVQSASGGSPAEILQAQLADIGVDVEILTSPDTADVPRLDPDGLITAIRPTGLTPYFRPEASGGYVNWCGYQSDELEAALAVVSSGMANEDEVTEAWHGVSAALLDDLAVIWLVNEPMLVAHDDHVIGIERLRPLAGQAADLRTVAVAAD